MKCNEVMMEKEKDNLAQTQHVTPTEETEIV